MCGILFIKSFIGKKVNKRIRKTYFNQKTRGSDGFGFIALYDDKLKLFRTEYEHEVMRYLKINPSTEIMFHHRFPTSTKNNVKTNHPIYTRSSLFKSNYYLIHNGNIMNNHILKMEHERLGIEYNTIDDYKFNDSEALLHELALCLEGKKKFKDFDARGSMAFILLETDKNNNALNLFFGRKFNPLKMKFDEEVGLFLSSEAGKDTDDIDINTLYRFDYKERKLDKVEFDFGYSNWYNDNWGKTKNKQIAEQNKDDRTTGTTNIHNEAIRTLNTIEDYDGNPALRCKNSFRGKGKKKRVQFNNNLNWYSDYKEDILLFEYKPHILVSKTTDDLWKLYRAMEEFKAELMEDWNTANQCGIEENEMKKLDNKLAKLDNNMSLFEEFLY